MSADNLRRAVDQMQVLDQATEKRLAQMQPLGIQRLRVLDCLRGNDTFYGHLFSPNAQGDVFSSFRSYILDAVERWASYTDPVSRSNLAAGRLLIGDIAAAQTIIDLLPLEPYKSDHGAGRCLVAAVYALNNILPLPPDLKDIKRWTANSTEQAALRLWLAEHCNHLRWIEQDGMYVRVG